MPRTRQAQGRPGTQVIPAGWGESHAGVIGRALTSTVTIGPAGGVRGWNEGLGQSQTAPAAAAYEGVASVMAVSDSARILTVVEDPTSSRVYDVTLPLDGAGADNIETDHVVTVTSSDDPDLTGKHLRVTAIERGSQRFSRVLLALLLD